MLRGNYSTRIDAKGRLKIPAEFRRLIEEKYGTEFYLTSIKGDQARLYPLPVWIAIEEKLASVPDMDPAKQKFLRNANYYGRSAGMDGQGRLLIHPLLRQSAELDGEVSVVGKISYLEVWNAPKHGHEVKTDPYTDDDAASIAKFGI